MLTFDNRSVSVRAVVAFKVDKCRHAVLHLVYLLQALGLLAFCADVVILADS